VSDASGGRVPGSRIQSGPSARSCSWAHRVGKTELARAWRVLFDDDTAMVRLDMSEYMEKFSVSHGRRLGIRRVRRGRPADRGGSASAYRSSCSTRSRRHTRTYSTPARVLDDAA